MAVNALVKGMIGGALKERAQKIGKTKVGKLLGREKRVMMGQPQPKAQVGASKQTIQPQQSLAPVAPDVGEEGGAPKSFKTEEETALHIKNTTIEVATLLKGSYTLEKEQLKNKKKKTEKEKRESAEGKLEKDTPKVKGFKMPKMPGGGLLSKVFGFVGSLVFGMVMVKLIDWLPTLKKILPILGRVADWIIDGAIWIVDALGTVIDFGYKLVDKMNEWVKNTFGEEGAEKFNTFMTNLKDLFTGFLVWKIIGQKIFDAVVKNIKFAFNVAKSIAVNAFRFVNFISGGTIGRGFQALGQGLSKVGGWIGKKTGLTAAKKMGGSLFKHGAKRAGKRVLLKMFGKTFVKTASKIFGRVPIIGPLIVGLVSLVAGEPIGKALFKTFGAALGGFLGSIAGTAITGALAVGTAGIGGFLGGLILPASVMIGEILGTFIGDALYGLIFEGGLAAVGKKLKEAFVAIVEKIGDGLEAVKKFFTEGFERFVNNFPTIDISKVWGLPRALGAAAGLLGLKDSKWVEDGKVNKLPNLALLTPFGLPFMIPHLINSFFPSGDGAGPDEKSVSGGDKSSSKKPKGEIITDQRKVSARFDMDTGKGYINEKEVPMDEYVKFQNMSSEEQLDQYGKPTSFETKLTTANNQGGAQGVIDSISTSASYEDGAAETITVPSPSPQSSGDTKGGKGSVPLVVSGGGKDDPFDALYKGS